MLPNLILPKENDHFTPKAATQKPHGSRSPEWMEDEIEI